MGRTKTVVHRYVTYDSSARRSDNLDELDVRRLAGLIVSQAVEDWVYLIRLDDLDSIGVEPKRRANYKNARVGNSNYVEILNFLNSDYGQTLCDIISVSPEAIKAKLMRWKTDYEETGAIPKYIFQRE